MNKEEEEEHHVMNGSCLVVRIAQCVGSIGKNMKPDTWW